MSREDNYQQSSSEEDEQPANGDETEEEKDHEQEVYIRRFRELCADKERTSDINYKKEEEENDVYFRIFTKKSEDNVHTERRSMEKYSKSESKHNTGTPERKYQNVSVLKESQVVSQRNQKEKDVHDGRVDERSVERGSDFCRETNLRTGWNEKGDTTERRVKEKYSDGQNPEAASILPSCSRNVSIPAPLNESSAMGQMAEGSDEGNTCMYEEIWEGEARARGAIPKNQNAQWKAVDSADESIPAPLNESSAMGQMAEGSDEGNTCMYEEIGEGEARARGAIPKKPNAKRKATKLKTGWNEKWHTTDRRVKDEYAEDRIPEAASIRDIPSCSREETGECYQRRKDKNRSVSNNANGNGALKEERVLQVQGAAAPLNGHLQNGRNNEHADDENVYENIWEEEVDNERVLRAEANAQQEIGHEVDNERVLREEANAQQEIGNVALEDNTSHRKVLLSTKKRMIIIITIIVLLAISTTFIALFIEKMKNTDSSLSNTLMELNKCPKQQQEPPNEDINKIGSRGKRFLIAFIQNPNSTKRTILVISEGNFTLSVHYYNTGFDLNITTSREGNKTIKIINIHISRVSPFLTIGYDAILLETTEVATVLVIDKDGSTTDSTTIIPTEKLSANYLIATASSYNHNIDSGSHFVITPVNNNTFVAMQFAIDKKNSSIRILNQFFRNGETFTIKLNKLQTFHVVHEADLSGTTINASKPVAVFVGNRCSPIGYQGRCSKLMEQAVPVERLDNTYIVPPNMHGHSTLVSMISPYMTQVKYTVGGIITNTLMLQKRHVEFAIRKNEIAVIESNMPLLVSSFTTGTGNVYGGPYMVTIPGINQYLDEYQVILPNGFNASFTTMISQNMSLSNFRLNGINIEKEKIIFNTAVLLRKISYRVVILEVPSGIIEMKTTDKSRFGLIVYGQRPHDGHGFAGNALLEIPHSCTA